MKLKYSMDTPLGGNQNRISIDTALFFRWKKFLPDIALYFYLGGSREVKFDLRLRCIIYGIGKKYLQRMLRELLRLLQFSYNFTKALGFHSEKVCTDSNYS